MKTLRVLVFSAASLLACIVGHAQAIDFVVVSRQANYVQTGVSTVTAASSMPFVFRAEVEGDNSTTSSAPITAATYTAPGGSATALAFDAQSKSWRFEDSAQTSMANLNGVYGTGGYDFALTGTPSGIQTVNVSSFASTTLQIPMLTLSGGTWVGSTYQINTSATLTIAFNAVYTGTVASTDSFHYNAEIFGNSYSNNVDGFINYDATTSAAAPNVSTPPNFQVSSLAAGTYTFSAGFEEVQNPASIYSNTVFSASLLEYRTSITVSVIPEPSTYAAILGALALAGVAIHRRRRAA